MMDKLKHWLAFAVFGGFSSWGLTFWLSSPTPDVYLLFGVYGGLWALLIGWVFEQWQEQESRGVFDPWDLVADYVGWWSGWAFASWVLSP